jgi:RNA polymerase sigma factor for flagellar operon FliA
MALAHTAYKVIIGTAKDCEERDELILQELPQVHYIASRMLERLPQQVELADLVQAGVIGLLQAHRLFDPTKNTQFSTFAKFRIKGAIIDSLRALDWGSRGIRKKARDIAEATARLEGALGRSPTNEEVASMMRISLDSLNEIQHELSLLFVVGQEAQSSFEGEAAQDLIESAPSNWENPFDIYCKTEERAHLVRAVSELPEREQLILSLYYTEELTMKEVAEIVGLAVSRVSQIHAESLRKLRLSLTPAMPPETVGAGERLVHC